MWVSSECFKVGSWSFSTGQKTKSLMTLECSMNVLSLQHVINNRIYCEQLSAAAGVSSMRSTKTTVFLSSHTVHTSHIFTVVWPLPIIQCKQGL